MSDLQAPQPAHTPGPWHFVNGNQIRSERHQIARTWSMRGGEGSANARLIAAAPELLQALAAMVTAFAWGDMNDGEAAAIKEARAALIKATGAQA